MFSKIKTKLSMRDYSKKIKQLNELINKADAIVIGAGSGLSTAAGLIYSGERFKQYFSDFEEKYGIQDMYSGGFYPFASPEEYWAFWSRNIWINRYMSAPKNTYQKLLNLIKNKNYFVITTNVDHQFQQAGFNKKRLFYTQGDYGLFQSDRQTYDNYDAIKQMILAQGFKLGAKNELIIPAENLKTMIPSDLIPRINGNLIELNLRVDDNFVEDQGWHQAAKRYHDFLAKYAGSKILYLELGVGLNTPGIIKYPFWQLTIQNPKANYVSINQGKVLVAEQIVNRSLAISNDIDQVFNELMKVGI